MQPRIFHLHALSALHCGTGQSVGVVDLPIARARATQLPIVPGSSLRGVLRAHMGESHADTTALFGPRTISGPDDHFAGALAVGDAHLLLLPVRSLAGILCYATSPFILRRYRQDLTQVGIATPELPAAPGRGQARVAHGSVNCIDGKLVLEELDLAAQEDSANGPLTAWAGRIAQAIHPEDEEGQVDLRQRIALLPDDILSFLAETATEIRTRIAIDPETGTVKRGALWYEENLPAEAVLWGVHALSASNRPKDERDARALAAALPASGVLLQLGGKAGVGRGLVRLLREAAA